MNFNDVNVLHYFVLDLENYLSLRFNAFAYFVSGDYNPKFLTKKMQLFTVFTASH